jgi:hypothetical protein
MTVSSLKILTPQLIHAWPHVVAGRHGAGLFKGITSLKKHSMNANGPSFGLVGRHWTAVRCQSRTLRGSSGFVSAASGLPSPPPPYKLLVYSKANCPLCDKLKEKLENLMERAAFMPSSVLNSAELEVRDIAAQPAWEARYAMEVPVLAACAFDGSNEIEIPRPSPRITAEALEKHIAKSLASKFVP